MLTSLHSTYSNSFICTVIDTQEQLLLLEVTVQGDVRLLHVYDRLQLKIQWVEVQLCLVGMH